MARKEYFAIVKGTKTGVFPGGWAHAQDLVKGVSGARYKGFATEVEADLWYDTHAEAATPTARGGIVAYVDGSNRSDGSAASWAYVLVEEDAKGAVVRTVDEAYGVVSEDDLPGTITLSAALEQRNILGECMAAMKAVRAIAMLPEASLTPVLDGDGDPVLDDEGRPQYQPVTVYHDYEGLGLWATRAWRAKNPLTQHYVQVSNPYVASGLVQFRHVKGHTGNAGNERADELAGRALGR